MGSADWHIGSGDGAAQLAPAGVTEVVAETWSGRFERTTFGPGFQTHLGALEVVSSCTVPVAAQDDGPPMLNVWVLRTGSGTLSMSGWPELELAPGRALLMVCSDRRGAFRLSGPQTFRFFSVAIAPEVLISLLDEQMPAALSATVESSRRTFVKSVALSGPMRALVDELDEPGNTGSLRRLRHEAVAVQLLTEVLEAAATEPARMTAREDAAVEAAREDLLSDLRGVPSASDLALRAGMAPRRFLRAFEAMHGASPAQLVRRERLRRARGLLEADGLSLKEIAWQVGYAHVSNFVAAFSDQFGAPPRRFQRGKHAAE